MSVKNQSTGSTENNPLSYMKKWFRNENPTTPNANPTVAPKQPPPQSAVFYFYIKIEKKPTLYQKFLKWLNYEKK